MSAEDCAGRSAFRRSVMDNCLFGMYEEYIAGMERVCKRAASINGGVSRMGYFFLFHIHSFSLHCTGVGSTVKSMLSMCLSGIPVKRGLSLKETDGFQKQAKN